MSDQPDRPVQPERPAASDPVAEPTEGAVAPLDPDHPVDGEPVALEPEPGSGLDADPQTAETPEFESAPPTAEELEAEGVTQSAPEPALEAGPASEPEPALEPAPASEPEPELEAAASPAPPALVEPETAPATADPALTSPDAAQRAAIADAEASARPDGLEFGEAPVAPVVPAELPPAAVPPAALAAEHRETSVIPAPTDPVATAAFAGIVGASDPGPEPVRRGNRGFGVGVALLSSLIFTGLYGVVAGLLLAYRTAPDGFESRFLAFLASVEFIGPVVVYVILGVLVALIVGRARWWAHALLSLVAGILVYALGVGLTLLFARVLTLEPEPARLVLVRTLGSPELIAAGIVARETLLWFGLITAARGRRLTARYARDREEWEAADRDARSAESGHVGG